MGNFLRKSHEDKTTVGGLIKAEKVIMEGELEEEEKTSSNPSHFSKSKFTVYKNILKAIDWENLNKFLLKDHKNEEQSLGDPSDQEEILKKTDILQSCFIMEVRFWVFFFF